jgi:hypothetical protein
VKARQFAGNAQRREPIPSGRRKRFAKQRQRILRLMNKMKRTIAVSLLLSITFLTVLLPSVYARQRITVRSNNFRYNYYRIQVRGRVELVNQLSQSPCDYGRSWGYDSSGVWVDDGCSAEFDVFDQNESRSNFPKISGKTAGIIAGGVGAAILIGVIASRKKNGGGNNKGGNNGKTTIPTNPDATDKEKVPSWLVGNFVNADKKTEIGIYEDGTVIVKDGNRERFYGNYYDGKIFYNGLKLEIAKDRNGFTATDLATKDALYFERVK